MIQLRSAIYPVLCAVALTSALACDTQAPSAPTSPPVLGTTVLVGTVLHTQTRQPIAGALITVNVQVAAPATRSALSNDDGTFRIESVLIGTGTVRVEAQGFHEFIQDLNFLGAEVRTEVALIPNGPPPPPPAPVLTTIGGLVTSRLTSLPINGATVTFTLTTGERFTANTVIDGRFTLNGVPVGAVGDLRVEATGHRADDSRYTVEPNLFITIGLDPG
jgi:hypothetical protein